MRGLLTILLHHLHHQVSAVTIPYCHPLLSWRTEAVSSLALCGFLQWVYCSLSFTILQHQIFVTGRCDLQYQDSPDSSPMLKNQSTYPPGNHPLPRWLIVYLHPSMCLHFFHSICPHALVCLSQPQMNSFISRTEVTLIILSPALCLCIIRHWDTASRSLHWHICSTKLNQDSDIPRTSS